MVETELPTAETPTADPLLVAQADAAMVGAPEEFVTEAGEPVSKPSVDAENEFRSVLRMPTMFVQRAVLPQWGITDEFRDEWAEACAQCLAQLFPDGINGKYACYFRLIAASTVITVTAISQNGGKLPGIGPKREETNGAEHGQATPA